MNVDIPEFKRFQIEKLGLKQKAARLWAKASVTKPDKQFREIEKYLVRKAECGSRKRQESLNIEERARALEEEQKDLVELTLLYQQASLQRWVQGLTFWEICPTQSCHTLSFEFLIKE